MTKQENLFCHQRLSLLERDTNLQLTLKHTWQTSTKRRQRRHDVIVVTLGVPALVTEMVGARGAGAPALSALGQRQKLQALGVHLAIVPQVVSNCKQGQFGLQLKVIVAM